MQIKIASVIVDDQDKALAFYTSKLGFSKMADILIGPTYRWLTVVSPEGVHGVELALQPVGFAPAKVYQQALYLATMPATAFLTDDVEAAAQRLRARGIVMGGQPQHMGPIEAVMFEDGCGNPIHLVQPLIKPE